MSDITNFNSNGIRRIWHEAEQQWYFAVVDIIELLVETERPSKYWSDLKKRVKKQSEIELSALCGKFPLKNPKNNRTYQTECASRENLFRILQSVPSPRVEPFKRWLAKVGNERVEEIHDPARAIERLRETYRLKGYDDDWIDKRLQSIAIRNELTDEWEARGVEKGREYAFLTAEISRATFELSPKEHKEVKGLKRQNLRDHMSSAELVFTMLGELSTTEIAREDDAQGYKENKRAAQEGGKIAGDARRQLEQRTGRKVVTSDNFLPKPKTPPSLDD